MKENVKKVLSAGTALSLVLTATPTNLYAEELTDEVGEVTTPETSVETPSAPEEIENDVTTGDTNETVTEGNDTAVNDGQTDAVQEEQPSEDQEAIEAYETRNATFVLQYNQDGFINFNELENLIKSEASEAGYFAFQSNLLNRIEMQYLKDNLDSSKDSQTIYLYKTKAALKILSTIKIEYQKVASNKLDVSNILENGSLKINSKKISSNEFDYDTNETLQFEIDPNNNYYVKSVNVNGNSQNINYSQGTASFTVTATEQMSVQVEYGQVFKTEPSVSEEGVSYKKGEMTGEVKEALEKELISYVTDNGCYTFGKEGAKVEYKKNSFSWGALDDEGTGIGQHKFGENKTERIRITYEDDVVGKAEIQFDVKVTFIEKLPSQVVLNTNEQVFSKNGSKQIEELIASIDKEASILPETYESSDFTVEYKGDILGFETWNEVSEENPIPEGKQTIVVKYHGNEDYNDSASTSYEIQVGKDSTLKFDDADIVLSKTNAENKQVNEILNHISSESDLPEDYDASDFVVKYRKLLLWYEVSEENPIPDGAQTIKVQYKGNDIFNSSNEVELSVQVGQKSVIVLKDNIDLTYDDGYSQKIALIAGIDFEKSTIPADSIAQPDDYEIKYKPVSSKISTWKTLTNDTKIPAGECEISYKFKGNEEYGASEEVKTTINVQKGTTSLAVNTQIISYKDELKPLISTADDAAPLTIIAGADIGLNPYICFNLDPNGLVITGNELIDKTIQSAIEQMFKDGKQLNLSEALRQLSSILKTVGNFVDLGFDTEIIDKILGLLPENAGNLIVRFNQVPEDSGTYIVVGATLNQNYKTAVGVGNITILPDATSKKLVWRNELGEIWAGDISTDPELSDMSFWEADLVDRSLDPEIKYSFSGVTSDGIEFNSDKPIDKAGYYTQIAYVKLGANEWAPAISRSYTVKAQRTIQINGDSAYAEFTYDSGSHNMPNTAFELKETTSGKTFTPEQDQLQLTYTNVKTGVITQEAPTEVGHYIVAGLYTGDDNHIGCPVVGSMRITPAEVTVKINDVSKTAGEADPEFTYSVIDGTVYEGDDLGIVLGRDKGEDADEYRIYCTNDESLNPNYNIGIQNGILTINPKMEILNQVPVINANDVTLTVGDEFDPLKDVSASDTEDGDITASIKVIANDVDTSKAGEYHVTYEVTDSQGATTTKTITVTVNPKMEILNQVPVINASDVTLTVGDKFDPLKDVSASDTEDGDITASIKVIANDVDTSKAGEYHVTYEVTDSQGATTTKTITVTVKNKVVGADKENKDDSKKNKGTNTAAATNAGLFASLAAFSGVMIGFITSKKRKKAK